MQVVEAATCSTIVTITVATGRASSVIVGAAVFAHPVACSHIRVDQFGCRSPIDGLPRAGFATLSAHVWGCGGKK